MNESISIKNHGTDFTSKKSHIIDPRGSATKAVQNSSNEYYSEFQKKNSKNILILPISPDGAGLPNPVCNVMRPHGPQNFTIISELIYSILELEEYAKSRNVKILPKDDALLCKISREK
jgi:hypothetical protein